MNQAVSTNHLQTFRRLPLVILLLFLLLLTACFGGGNDTTQDTAATDQTATQGNLVCSPACSSQGQCGTTADGRTVILAHDAQPATRDHNVILANDSIVNLLGQEQRSVQDTATGNISTLNFFLVQPVDGGLSSWVAGGCVNRTTQP